MPKTFKRGDHVQWNSEAGIVRGVIIKKITSNVRISLQFRLANTLTRQSMTQSHRASRHPHRSRPLIWQEQRGTRKMAPAISLEPILFGMPGLEA